MEKLCAFWLSSRNNFEALWTVAIHQYFMGKKNNVIFSKAKYILYFFILNAHIFTYLLFHVWLEERGQENHKKKF